MQRGLPTILVEPRTLLREGLAALLSASRFKVIASVATPAEIDPATLGRAGLVVVGVCGRSSKALEWLEAVAAVPRPYRIVAVAEGSDQDAAPDVSRVLRCGADGYIVNVRSREVLHTSLDLALLGQKVVVLGEAGSTLSASRTPAAAVVEKAPC